MTTFFLDWNTEIIEILNGVLTSILAVILIETYLYIKRKISNFKLQKVLSLRGGSCIIASPLEPFGEAERISYRDAYAFGHLFEICSRINVNSKFVSYNRLEDTAESEDILSVGGPITNSFTAQYLQDFVPSFHLIYDETPEDDQNPQRAPDNKFVVGFKIGNSTFMGSDGVEYGVLVKFSPNELDQVKTVHLIFGYSGHGTSGAAYYLSTHFDRIYKKFKQARYFIIIEVREKENYRNLKLSFSDLTEQAFYPSDSDKLDKVHESA